MKTLVEQRFGRLTVLFDGARSVGPVGKRRVFWTCQCDCGFVGVVDAQSLKSGVTQSCGCANRKKSAQRMKGLNFRHGMSGHPIQQTWNSMLSRCYRADNAEYRNYGGRGIRVCEYLRSDPRHLLDILGERPLKHSLDRIDNNGHYACGVCAECLRCGYFLNIRWATALQQNSNKRNNRWIEFQGRRQTLSQWCRELHLSPTTAYRNLRAGRHPLLRRRAPNKRHA